MVAARPLLVRLRRFLLAPIEEELHQMRGQIEEVRQAAARVAVPTQDGNVLVRTTVGYVLCSTTDLGTLAPLVETGELERGTRLVIERVVGPGAVFVDVGANLGLHTLAAGHAMRGRGRIHAFEPFAPTAALLRETVQINGLSDVVQIHQVAASDHMGRQKLFLGAVSGHHSLFPLGTSEAQETESVEVELVRLDDALADTAPVDLIKIDVEGAELDVLDGARSTIERSPEIALVVEFGPAHLARVGHSVPEWFARFESLGLVFRAIDNDGRLMDRTIASLEDVESVNLLFARPDARAWIRAGPG
jgi:FkbM family methyltransferase